MTWCQREQDMHAYACAENAHAGMCLSVQLCTCTQAAAEWDPIACQSLQLFKTGSGQVRQEQLHNIPGCCLQTFTAATMNFKQWLHSSATEAHLLQFVWRYVRRQEAQRLPQSHPDRVGAAGLAGLPCTEPCIRAAAAAAAAGVCYAEEAVREG